VLLLVDALLMLAGAVLIVSGTFVVFFAIPIASGELASPVHQIGSRTFYLVLHTGLVLGVGLIWQRAGRPPLWNPVPDLAAALRPRRILPAIKSDPVLAGLACVVMVIYLAGGVAAVLLPTTSTDAQTYHLSRVVYWMQQRSLDHWSTPDLRQTAFPVNFELNLLWLMVMSGTDHLTNLLQWTSLPILLAAIVGLTQQVGYTRRQGMFAAFIFASLPQVFLQAVETKNDLLVSVLFGCAIYLLFQGLNTDHKGSLILSGMAFGLLAGTKSTPVMILPGLAIFVLLAWRKYGRLGFWRLWWWGLTGLAAFALLGAYNYILNLRDYDSLLGPSEFVEDETHESDVSLVKMLVVNSIRYSYQMVDTSGLPRRIAYPLFDAKARAARAVINRLGLHEVESRQMSDTAFNFNHRPRATMSEMWFGPLGIMLLGVFVVETVRLMRTRNLWRAGLLLMAWSYLPVLSTLTAWSTHKGRYTMLMVMLVVPLIGRLYRPGSRFRLFYWGLCGLAGVVLIWTFFGSEYRPLVGRTKVWKLDRIEQQTIAYPPGTAMVKMVDRYVPKTATLGLWFQRGDWDYPLFGDDFSRTLVQIYPYPETLDRAWLAQQAFRFIIANTSLLPSPLPAELTVVGETSLYTLLRYDPAP
jgi:hypothetical protein